MITFTKGQLIAAACSRIDFAKQMLRENPLPLAKRKWEIELSLSEIALASLEAEAVGEVIEQQSGMMLDGLVISEKPTYRNIKGIHKMKMMPLGTKFYTAPPAPVSVMDEAQSRELFEKNCMANIERNKWHPDLYAHLPAREQWAAWEACRNAMLQGAEQPQNEQQNIPENIPATQFKSVADLYGLTSPTGGETSFTFDAVEARDFIDGGWSCQEYVQLERFQEAVSGNSPVIPDEALSAIRKVARIRADFDDFDGDRRGIGDCLDEAEQELIVTINKHASVIAAAPQQEVKP